MLSLMDAAKHYANKGWRVLPLHSIDNGVCTCYDPDCKNVGKHPLAKLAPHGSHDATTDHAIIEDWWTREPNANIGIATGAVSGIVVVDIDAEAGGYESMTGLDLTDTRTSATGGGGLHLIYECRDEIKQVPVARGIDIRARGGYIVAPPSLHKSGNVYTWVDEGVPLAPLPSFIRMARSPGKANGIVVEADQKDWVVSLLTTPVPDGQRNTTLSRIAGYFRNIMPESVNLTLCEDWNRRCCQPPLTVEEIRKTVHGMYTRYQGLVAEVSTTWTSRSLLAADLPPPTWVVDGLLPEGLCFLGGRPKRGKSWLALQVAIDVVSKGDRLGETTPGRVIYLALEDSPRRLQGRLRLMRHEGSDDLIFLNTFPALDNGGVDALVDLIDVHRPVLIVVDTLARCVGAKRDQDSISDMTELLGPLQALALNARCCIWLLDHHRKPGQDISDSIDDLMGSTAKTAVADAILGLYRKSGESTATLKVTGRDVEEKEIGLTWDGLRFQWKIGTVAGNGQQRQITELLDYITEQGQIDADGAKEILGVEKTRAYEMLTGMCSAGTLRYTYEKGTGGRPRRVFRLSRGLATAGAEKE